MKNKYSIILVNLSNIFTWFFKKYKSYLKTEEMSELAVKKVVIILPILFFTVLSFAQKHIDFVDPFICTSDDHGQTDVAAAVPFGMIKPCPDTNPTGHSGYDYSANKILGFSQTRFSGTGCNGTGGNIRIFPFLQSKESIVPSEELFLKNSEKAIPGFYSVRFINGIEAALTANRQVAYYQFKYPQNGKAGISIDLNSSFTNNISEIHQLDNENILSGSISSSGVCGKGDYTFYYALFIKKSKMKIKDEASKLIFDFNVDTNEIISVYCALSVVSQENAKETLKKGIEIPFNIIKEKAYQSWSDFLDVVDVETSNDTFKRIFYTHLYHIAQSPFIINDENGQYRGDDGKLYQSHQPYFYGWSIWDTFRTKFPLLSFLFPKTYSQLIHSLKLLYIQGKNNWSSNGSPFLNIRTEHSAIVLLEAERKGLLPFSLEEIYPLIKKEIGELSFETPDKILESSYDFWALSEIAKDLGYSEDYKEYRIKAFQYQKIWNQYFNNMDESSDIMHHQGLYEGTLWQYRWFVPFDITGIQKIVGGKQIFEKQLDQFFSNNLFNIGNQPDIQVPYLYAYTSSPWKTQQVISQLLKEPTENWYGTHEKWKVPEIRKIFTDTPKGYISEMDDDAGTMSSWFIWSSIGLYPVFPGDTKLVITTPLFDKTTVNIGDKRLTIVASGLSDENKYIKNIKFNGIKLTSCFIDFNDLVKGGILKLEMGKKTSVGM